MASPTWRQALIDMSGGTAPTWEQAILNTANTEINVRTVGPGRQYTTVQAAVDAAAIVYGVSGVEQVVVVSPGVKMDFVPSVGVQVVRQVQTGTSQFGRYPAKELFGPTYALNQPCGLISLRSDDIYATWLTADATFAVNGVNRSAAYYAWFNGVVVSHGICQSHIELGLSDASKLTPTQLQSMYEQYAIEPVCHSKTHGSSPQTQAELETETSCAKRYLQNLAGPTARPGGGIGWNVRGFFQPGSWGTGADSATGIDGRIDNFLDYDKWTGRQIRETFEWSGCDAHGGAEIVFHGPVAHFTRYVAISNAVFASLAEAKTYLNRMFRAGTRLEVLVHDPIQYKTKLKYAIDAIVALRDDRTTYPLRRIDPISSSALHLGIQSWQPQYDTTPAIKEPSGSVWQEELNAHPVAAYDTALSPYISKSSTLDMSIANDATEGNYMDAVTTRGAGGVNFIFWGLASGHYNFRVRAKGISAAQTLAISKFVYYDTTDNELNDETAVQFMSFVDYYISDAWQWVNIPFVVPNYSNGHGYLSFYLGVGFETGFAFPKIDRL